MAGRGKSLGRILSMPARCLNLSAISMTITLSSKIPYPENVSAADVKTILSAYLESYDHSDDQTQWFDKIREIAEANGYAARPKDYKKNPGQYKGHVGDVSTVIRIALMGRAMSPDIWEIQQILGEERTKERIKKAIKVL